MRALDLSDRTTNDLEAALAAHKAGEIRMAPQHVKAVKAEIIRRATRDSGEAN